MLFVFHVIFFSYEYIHYFSKHTREKNNNNTYKIRRYEPLLIRSINYYYCIPIPAYVPITRECIYICM